MDLKEKINSLPKLPGVYLMKDYQDSIIYVGKSKKLKSRVGSYFQNSKSRSPKVEKLTKHLKDFDYIITDTEFEAFILECKLIKEIKPLYNKQMKSPMSYPYIRINMDEKFPYIEISDEYDNNDGSLYFGPYTNRNTVENGILGIKECCRILCTGTSKRTSPCLNYSLGLCIGMCLEDADMDQYFLVLDRIANHLRGIDKSILEEMDYMMNSACERFDFENAARYRDYIGAVSYLINSANAVGFAEENENIALVEYMSDGIFKFFLIKGNRILFSEKYPAAELGLKKLKSILADNILYIFKSGNSVNSAKISKEEVDQAHIIYNYLKNNEKTCRHFIVPDSWIENQDKESISEAICMLLAR